MPSSYVFETFKPPWPEAEDSITPEDTDFRGAASGNYHTSGTSRMEASPSNRVPAPSSIDSTCPLASAPRQKLLLHLHLSSSQLWEILILWPHYFLAQKQLLVESLFWGPRLGRGIALNAQR